MPPDSEPRISPDALGSTPRSGSNNHCQGTEAAHTALLYDGDEAYVAGVLAFLAPSLQAGDPIALAVPDSRAEQLRDALGTEATRVQILDVAEMARNPARIIPAVLTLLERHGGRRLHYVGETIWPGRSALEVQEALRHEALVNVAWPAASLRALCLYDAAGLPASVLRDVHSTHPWVMSDGAAARNDAFSRGFPEGTDHPLPDPPPDAVEVAFGLDDLGRLRTVVARHAQRAGLHADTCDDLVIAVNEVATNAIKYAPRDGRLRMWCTSESVVCQLEDRGHIADPLAGRHRPVPGVEGGLGLWLVNQLCDLVQTRTTPAGTTTRLHARVS